MNDTLRTMIAGIITLSIMGLLFIVIHAYASKADLQVNIAKQSIFWMDGREYKCENTLKQLEIDSLNEKINEIKSK